MAIQLPAIITDTYKKLTGIKIVVNSPETRAAVVTYQRNLAAFIKQHKAGVKLLKAPFKEEIDKIDALQKPILEDVEAREEECTGAILAWDLKERQRIQRENDKKLVKYDGKLATAEAEAAATGKEVKFVAPPALKPEPAKTVAVDGGTQTTVVAKSWWLPGVPQPKNKFGLFDGDPSEEFKGVTMLQNQASTNQIPPEYFVLDVVTVGKVIRAGGTIPGIDMVEVLRLSNRAS